MKLICPIGLKTVGVALLAYAALLLMGCSDSEPNLDRVSSLDVFTQGVTIHRLVGGTAGSEDQAFGLHYQNSDDGGATWSRAVAVAPDQATPAKKVRRGEDAQVAAFGETVVAVWAGRGGGVWGSGPLGVAVSPDRGQTWMAGPEPAVFDQDGSQQQGARFPALTATAEGFHLVWIDASDDRRSVRYSRSDPTGMVWTPPTVIDATSCACCWNELIVGQDGELIFVYRDDSPRDMTAVVSADGGRSWSSGVAVGEFGWAFEGCPHVGAGLSAQEPSGRVHASVWTGAQDKVGVYALYSDDGGVAWSEPRLLSEHGTHPRILAVGEGRVVACWTENLELGPRLRWAVSTDDGETWSDAVEIVAEGVYPSHGRWSHARGVTRLHWTEENDAGDSVLRQAVIDLP